MREHVRRLQDSAKIYRIDIPYSIDELCQAMTEVVRVNKMDSCYSARWYFAATATWA